MDFEVSRFATPTVPLHATELAQLCACPLRVLMNFGTFSAPVHIKKTTDELIIGASVRIDFAKPKVASRRKKDPNGIKRRTERR